MSLPTYLDLAGFRTRTLMPVAEVDYVEQESPGYVVARIAVHTSYLHGRLRKRYGNSLPFSSPYPEIIVNWLVMLTTYDVIRKRGVNPADPAAEAYKADSERALAEIKEASEGDVGMFDLPSPEEGPSNVTTGGPMGYTETSPYVGLDKERTTGRSEDRSGEGSGDV